MRLSKLDVWFLTGSQHLYGEEALKQVAVHSREIVEFLNKTNQIQVNIVLKPILTTPEEITKVCLEANSAVNCIGVISWCHTFSPSKMWINGLKILNKPLLHLHTQYNRDLPWQEIDMDFMNLNQAAHGDREHGYIISRLRLNHKIVVGHWQEPEVLEQIGVWSRAAAGWHELQHLKITRFGDNMREVAVTEGDKVEAQIRFGFSVNTYGVGDLVKLINEVSNEEAKKIYQEYEALYEVAEDCRPGGVYHQHVLYQAKIELALKQFLEDGGFGAYTDTFEDLTGLEQLPGLATQRMMAAGYGFGAEGDWKQAALVRVLKVMSEGLSGGTSFMEDYTYHLDPNNSQVLGAHMLEICPSIAGHRPRLEVHPLSIGGKREPARLVFSAPSGPAVNVTLIDMGNRFRLIVNEVDCVEAPELPKLPVARALWVPKPDLKTGAAAWILAGGAHHTAFTQALTSEYLEDLATIAGIEFIKIDSNTNITDLKKELRWNEVYYRLYE